MAGFDICPWWMGYIIDNPLRALWQKPERFLRQYVEPGSVCLDIGCGLGFFTLPMARCTGQNGAVHAVDLQEKMLSGLACRAQKTSLESIVQPRKCEFESLKLGDLAEQVDFALAGYMIHEAPDQPSLFAEVAQTLRPAGAFMILEPSAHVSQDAFIETLAFARQAGFATEEQPKFKGSKTALLRKMSA